MKSYAVQRLGAYLAPDADGYLQSIAKGSNIVEPWSDAVSALVRACVSTLPRCLHSIYVRGSVAKGTAIPGVSDLDSVVVLTPRASLPEGRASLNRLGQESEAAFLRAYPFVNGVETHVVAYDVALARTSPDAFILKVESACVHGEDLTPLIKPFRIGPEIALQTRHFRSHLDEFLTEYPDEPVADRPEFIAWILRRFLRLGMELVMIEEQRFTRDLYLCWDSFSKHYPAESGRMRRALELAVNPVADSTTERFVRSFGTWLAAEADAKLAQWGRATGS